MWHSRIFWRLFGTYGLLLSVAIGLLGWWLWQRLEQRLVQNTQQNLAGKLLLVAELLAEQTEPNQPAELQSRVKRWGDVADLRVTLIAADGRVLADSLQSPGQMDNHLDREEIRQAAEQELGFATRQSATLQQTMMYAARRVDGEPVRFVRMALPLVQVEQDKRVLQGIVLTTVGLTLAATLLASLLIARRFSTPLVALAAAARAFQAGEFDRGLRSDLRHDSPDEIGQLSRAFDDMSRFCATRMEQMERDRHELRTVLASMAEGVLVVDRDQRVQFFNEAALRMLNLSQEVRGQRLWQCTRQAQLNEAVGEVLNGEGTCRREIAWQSPEPRTLLVQGARLHGDSQLGAVFVLHDVTQLRQLERMRQDFVANVSHELKTPLAAIKANVETLIDGAWQDVDHGPRFLRRIHESAERLHRLVLDLLSLGRIESGREQFQIEPTGVLEAVEASLARHEHLAAGRGVRLLPPDSPGNILVRADEEALAEILDNLVENAVKYTPADGEVAVAWSRVGEQVAIRVRDTGIGIPEKELPRVFERFYRVDRARSRELGGTGLGLSIVKHLVGALNGSVTATSEVGVGSTFTVHLPRADAA